MADLATVVNQIVGVPAGTTGFRYYCNHSATAIPGAGAEHALTINTKLEGSVLNHIDDKTTELPAVFFDTVGAFPQAVLMGKHYDCTFRVRVYYLDNAVAGEIPVQSARTAICKITDNIMASDKLGLSWLDSLSWTGFNDDNDVMRFLGIVLQDYFAASSTFEIRAGVTF